MTTNAMTEDEREEWLNDLERAWRKAILPQVRKAIRDFKAEIGLFGKCCRLTYLYGEELYLITATEKAHNRYKAGRKYLDKFLAGESVKSLESALQKVQREIREIENEIMGKKIDGITEEMIERAKEYPLESFVELKRGMALCPFHAEKTPSMSVKDNRFHCFGCGKNGDVIQFVMETQNKTFREAVKMLAGE